VRPHPPAPLTATRRARAAARNARKDKEAEFNELMDVKISLDEELKTYRCLLEREEERLGITPVQDRTKRRRTTLTGPVPYVCTLDMTNDCVTVRNAGDEPVALGGYSLKSDSAVEQAFVFPADFELRPGASVTVWSGKKNQRRRRDPQTELWWSARCVRPPAPRRRRAISAAVATPRPRVRGDARRLRPAATRPSPIARTRAPRGVCAGTSGTATRMALPRSSTPPAPKSPCSQPRHTPSPRRQTRRILPRMMRTPRAARSALRATARSCEATSGLLDGRCTRVVS
jgi:hypothetical protein